MKPQRRRFMIYGEILVERFTFVVGSHSFAAIHSTLPELCQKELKTVLPHMAVHLPSWEIVQGKLRTWYSGWSVQGSLGTTQLSKVNRLRESAFAFFLHWKERGKARHSCSEPLSAGFPPCVLGGTDVHMHSCLSCRAVDAGDTP